MPDWRETPYSKGWDVDNNGSLSEYEKVRAYYKSVVVPRFGGDEAAAAKWYNENWRGELGIPVGPSPNMSADESRALRIADSSMPKDVHHADELRQRWEAAALSERRANPYDMEAARRTHGAQGALYEQMGALQAGPSAVDLQARAALGRNAMSAGAAMGLGGALGARGALGQQQGIGGDFAARAAQARLAEQLGMSQGRFGVASNLRGGSIQTADEQARFGQAIRELDNRRALSAIQGANALQNARATAMTNYDRANASLVKQDQANTMQGVNSGLGILGGVLGGFLK